MNKIFCTEYLIGTYEVLLFTHDYNYENYRETNNWHFHVYYVYTLITKIYFYYYNQYYHVNKNFYARKARDYPEKKYFHIKK